MGTRLPRPLTAAARARNRSSCRCCKYRIRAVCVLHARHYEYIAVVYATSQCRRGLLIDFTRWESWVWCGFQGVERQKLSEPSVVRQQAGGFFLNGVRLQPLVWLFSVTPPVV